MFLEFGYCAFSLKLFKSLYLRTICLGDMEGTNGLRTK